MGNFKEIKLFLVFYCEYLCSLCVTVCMVYCEYLCSVCVTVCMVYCEYLCSVCVTVCVVHLHLQAPRDAFPQVPAAQPPVLPYQDVEGGTPSSWWRPRAGGLEVRVGRQTGLRVVTLPGGTFYSMLLLYNTATHCSFN